MPYGHAFQVPQDRTAWFSKYLRMQAAMIIVTRHRLRRESASGNVQFFARIVSRQQAGHGPSRHDSSRRDGKYAEETMPETIVTLSKRRLKGGLRELDSFNKK